MPPDAGTGRLPLPRRTPSRETLVVPTRSKPEVSIGSSEFCLDGYHGKSLLFAVDCPAWSVSCGRCLLICEAFCQRTVRKAGTVIQVAPDEQGLWKASFYRATKGPHDFEDHLRSEARLP